jgi:TonB family protein
MTRTNRFIPEAGGKFLLCFLIGMVVSLPACAQRNGNSTLVGEPLYLRGFWMSDELEFDSQGSLLGKSDVGPITLSGIDVKAVHQNGRILELTGTRMALVANPGGSPGLHRQALVSTTHIMFSLRRGNNKNYYAPEEMRIKLHADANGSFDAALTRIFANGFSGLASSVPIYWECYARSYFMMNPIPADAEDRVAKCVITPDEGTIAEDGLSPGKIKVRPVMISSLQPTLPSVAAELHVQGTLLIHLRVRSDGTPVGLQIVQAVGGGVEESVLQAMSQARFRPATVDGKAIADNMTFSFHIASADN